MMANMDFEDIFHYIGHLGPYQFLIFILVAFLGIFHGYEALGMIFLGLNQDHFCLVDELREFPYEMQKYIAIPKVSIFFLNYLTVNKIIEVIMSVSQVDRQRDKREGKANGHAIP